MSLGASTFERTFVPYGKSARSIRSGLMSVGGRLWRLRRRILGPERVVERDGVTQLLGSSALGMRARIRIRALHAYELGFGPPRRATIRTGSVQVRLGGGEDFPVDWKVFVEVFGHETYRADYRDAHVLDVGGHKGYFGVYAFAHGASAVVSFEPAARNYDVLVQTARPLRARWQTRNVALGAASANGVLLLDRTSWAHSLMHVERPAGEQRVAIATLEEALAELPRGGSRTIVKIDAEGSECDIVARPEALDRVDRLMIEWHPETAPCTTHDLVEIAASAGLDLVSDAGLLRFTRH
jgi:FkbM family methyltransferase